MESETFEDKEAHSQPARRDLWSKQQLQEEEEVSKGSKRSGNEVSGGETRRVQLTGGSTLVVSLPSDWAKSVGLKAKDEVFIMPQTDMSLLVMPGPRTERTSERTIEISANSDEEETLRAFIANYIAGYDVIRLRFRSHVPELRAKLKAHVRDKLIGVEIVEETSEGILAQCLHGYVDLPLKKALVRMSIITSSMQFDAVKSLSEGDTELASEIIDRDDEVDRFYHFITRQLNLAVHNRRMIQEIGLSTAQDCLNYRLIVKSVERIADHAAQVASSEILLNGRKVPPSLSEHITKMSKLANEVYESSLRAVHTNSSRIANETILKLKQVLREEEGATEELISSRVDNKTVISLRLALESLRRIAEYSVDICEIVVNMSVGSPL
ncbi:MAG TPA: phosphate uptake regulator PhoU [Nitrososphaerales archaeon]|nr:phosphate uptake regulator PhoU [Nitrososphaerales archaeon]